MALIATLVFAYVMISITVIVIGEVWMTERLWPILISPAIVGLVAGFFTVLVVGYVGLLDPDQAPGLLAGFAALFGGWRWIRALRRLWSEMSGGERGFYVCTGVGALLYTGVGALLYLTHLA